MSESGVETNPDKIEKVKNWPNLKNADKLHSFIAFVEYYRRMVRIFPSSTKKKNPREHRMNGIRQLETEHEEFIRLKTILTNSQFLAFPDF